MKTFLLCIMVVLLLANFGCGGQPAETPKAPENGIAPVETPGDGQPEDEFLDGAALVEQRCGNCHGLAIVYNGQPEERWPGIVASMIARSPGLLDDEEKERVVDYLVENHSK